MNSANSTITLYNSACMLKLIYQGSHCILRILGPKRDEVTGGWRKLHNEELPDLYSSPSIIRITKSRGMVGGACSPNGEEERL
jgi:hypothetical protein